MSTKRALVCALMPEHDRDSGSQRVYDLLGFLQEAGWAVTFLSHDAKAVTRYANNLRQRQVPVYCGSSAWMDTLIAAGKNDLALFGLWHIAEPWMSLIRKKSPSTRIIVDSIDLHFLRNARRILREAAQSGTPGLLDGGYASEMVRELNTYIAADAVLTVSQKEADLINDLTGDPGLAYPVPDTEDLSPSTVPFSDRRGILFVGYFRHTPNVDAVQYLCEQVLPRIDSTLLAEHPVYIVGGGLREQVLRYGRELPYVHVLGWVPSVVPYFERARVAVVPLLYGAGTKRKLLQSLMLGTPTVSTHIGVEGLNLQDGEHLLVADDPRGFAEAITRLATDQRLWERIAQQGRCRIAEVHSREAVRASLHKVLSRALAKEPKAPLPAQVSLNLKPSPLPKSDYQQLIGSIRAVVSAAIPGDARVIVVSKGDDELLRLDGRAAWHFPRAESGAYAGYYPADSAGAIAHLEALRAQGGDFLLFPRTAFWWLEHYREFKEHLDRRYPQVGGKREVCRIYVLREHKATEPSPNGADQLASTSQNRQEARLIAFFLPQFHPIPENDRWWGKGFTEWTNVAKAQPLFPGHYQPHLPADLGFYDLRLAETRQAQADLARAYGVYGFCYYHYWFKGTRLLERPLDEVLKSGQPDFPFCLCWANEPWSRRWDGTCNEVLQPQAYSPEDDAEHMAWLIPALQDPRAITVDGKPLFLVYRAQDLPNPARTIETWRGLVSRAGLQGIYLLAVETGQGFRWDATRVGFDAKVLFQPHFSVLMSLPRLPFGPEKWPAVYDYQEVWRHLANPKPVSYKRYEAVLPSWDNSPRRGKDSVVLHNSTPHAYEQWLATALQRVQDQPPDQRIVFINAWNEWAEGCHLEPDRRYGLAYLQATKNALTSSWQPAAAGLVPKV